MSAGTLVTGSVGMWRPAAAAAALLVGFLGEDLSDGPVHLGRVPALYRDRLEA
ncbi:hypothetical protein [Sorangium sp. So ce1078]|uniref:hypothetical protein n=1 Tax=Sorangium sp. So ce1078 TaxID=3133329 RepID=UPI003F611E2E